MTATSGGPGRATEGRRTAAAIFLLLFLVSAVYWPVSGFEFVPFDDGRYVYRNPNVLNGLTPASVVWAFTSLHAGLWIPMTWLSLMIDTSIWGAGASGFHQTNLALHAAAVLLFYLLLRRLLGEAGTPLLAAALFAVHPLHVESVAWVTARKDVLSQMFFLLFLHTWLYYVRHPSRRRLVAALLVYVLAMQAKPMAVTAPLLLLVLDWWPLNRLHPAADRRFALMVEKVPAAIVGLGFGILTVVAQRRVDALAPLSAHSLPHRLGNALVTPVQNLGRMLWPADLSPLYAPPPGGTFPPATLAAAAVALLLLATVCHLLRRSAPWLAAGYAWYLLALVPVSGLLQAGSQVTADRFTYLPLLGMHTAVACLVARAAALRRRPARAVLLLLLPTLLTLMTLAAHRQALFWKNGVTLFSRAVAVSRVNPIAFNNLGVALVEAGRLPEAVPHFEAAVRLDPANETARRNLVGALGALGYPPQ